MSSSDRGRRSPQNVAQKPIARIAIANHTVHTCPEKVHVLERNRRIFDHKEAATGFLLTRIKEEASLWALAGAKRLRDLSQAGWFLYVIVDETPVVPATNPAAVGDDTHRHTGSSSRLIDQDGRGRATFSGSEPHQCNEITR
uniref:Uncharacterized protein n=1 Tax=Oryza glumipatula TaxID=40148 RepID=A0A0E0A1N9_9ORYZ